MKSNRPPRGGWSQPSPRAEMIAEVKTLDSSARPSRFEIGHGKPGHIDDEVVVTLLLDAWAAGQDREADSVGVELLRRVKKHVRAHVRKNPGWPRLGGGHDATLDDFCQDTVIAILEDKAVPCHAEVAFGNYVYRRCLDAAGRLYAKKHSAGESFDDNEAEVEAQAQSGDPADPSAQSKSPEQVLIEIEEFLAEQQTLEQIRRIVQEDLPELPQLAFTFRYFGQLKIESKKDPVTVTSLMGVTEKTATKYIHQAIEIIKQRLNND